MCCLLAGPRAAATADRGFPHVRSARVVIVANVVVVIARGPAAKGTRKPAGKKVPASPERASPAPQRPVRVPRSNRASAESRPNQRCLTLRRPQPALDQQVEQRLLVARPPAPGDPLA